MARPSTCIAKRIGRIDITSKHGALVEACHSGAEEAEDEAGSCGPPT